MGLGLGRVLNNAFDRTDSQALGIGMMTDTFGAKSRVDLIDLLPLRNGSIRAFRFADITIDAFVGN